MKPIVVIDTSVWIHYLIHSGAAVRKIVEGLWLSGEISVVSAPELIAELSGVLARSAMLAVIPEKAGQALIEVVKEHSEMLPSLGKVPELTRDPKDDKFVACAILAGADYLVTLDKDILVLGELCEVRMVTPLGFVEAVFGS